MSWSAIVNAFRRFDDRLSDAVYLHGRHLTGQEEAVRTHRAETAGKRLNLHAWEPVALQRIAHRHHATGSMRRAAAKSTMLRPDSAEPTTLELR